MFFPSVCILRYSVPVNMTKNYFEKIMTSLRACHNTSLKVAYCKRRSTEQYCYPGKALKPENSSVNPETILRLSRKNNIDHNKPTPALHPFQDYFSSYETGQSVGGRKRENREKNHLAHPQAELGLSHMWSVRGSPGGLAR